MMAGPEILLRAVASSELVEAWVMVPTLAKVLERGDPALHMA